MYLINIVKTFVSLSVTLVWRVLTRRQGVLYGNKQNAKSVAISKIFRIDKENLAAYKAVCQSVKDGAIPVCYMEAVMHTILFRLVLSPGFRLSPLGLIHLRQTIRQLENLDSLRDTDFTCTVRVLEYRSVPRGIEVDIVMSVWRSSQLCVWEGVLTLLSRSSDAQRSGMRKGNVQVTSDNDDEKYEKVPLAVESGTGVKYAKISGDWNPHHLYLWSARLLGYRRPIAHGMWTLATALAKIKEAPSPESVFSTPQLEIDASFKRPLFMPGKVEVLFKSLEQKSEVLFRVQDVTTKEPHVVGTIKSGSSET